MTEGLEVERRVLAGESSDWIELLVCPICDETASAQFETLDSETGQVVYQLCKRCGAVYQSPRMSEAALRAYYRAEYVSQHQRAEGVSEKELRVQSGRARHLLRLLRSHIAGVERHLDLGSSAGVLLESVREVFGCETVGVEPSEIYRRFTAARGLQVHPNLDELEAHDPRPFDLVSMAHVLEHLPDPVGYLRDLREKWLMAGGVLLVEVPNLFGHYSLERPHLFCFHAATLRRTLAAAGFETIALSVHGAPRSRLIPLYLTAIARPVPEPGSLRIRSSPAGIRLKRKLGMAWHRLASRLATRWAWLPLPELRSDSWSRRG